MLKKAALTKAVGRIQELAHQAEQETIQAELDLEEIWEERAEQELQRLREADQKRNAERAQREEMARIEAVKTLNESKEQDMEQARAESPEIRLELEIEPVMIPEAKPKELTAAERAALLKQRIPGLIAKKK